MSTLKTAIARAIRAADTSYFSEDYEKQAAAALGAIDKEGLTLMPKDAPEEVYARVAEKIPSGRVRPEELVKRIYQLTLAEMKASGG